MVVSNGFRVHSSADACRQPWARPWQLVHQSTTPAEATKVFQRSSMLLGSTLAGYWSNGVETRCRGMWLGFSLEVIVEKRLSDHVRSTNRKMLVEDGGKKEEYETHFVSPM